MSEQPILGYDWEMGHEEIKLEISTYYMGEDLYIGMLAKESGVWESFSDLTVNLPFERCKANEAFIQDFGSKDKLEFIKRHKLGEILRKEDTLGFSSSNSSSEPLSQEVLAYTSTIQKYASQYGIPEYVASIQAIMMQESGGKGTDPMQSSECPYNTRYPNRPGAIQDPEYSIQVGIQYYAACVQEAGCESTLDMGKLQLSWQGYNYGNGYISWEIRKYGGYSLENALQFSQEQAASHGWTSYGDPEYVPHVQRYYSGGSIFDGLFGNRQIVEIAKKEIGSSNGEKYWRWYEFDSYAEWCACFVSWCGEQAGLLDRGAMPKFSLCKNGVDWFKSHGKWWDRGAIPSTGSLIFFDWDGDGVSDHVGIVEKCEEGIIHTIEGNTGTRINGNQVRGVWQHTYTINQNNILGYGIFGNF